MKFGNDLRFEIVIRLAGVVFQSFLYGVHAALETLCHTSNDARFHALEVLLQLFFHLTPSLLRRGA
jgi:hypothetical protein